MAHYLIEVLNADVKDFQVWTEAEILALPQFGKVTLEKLKEAGVIFSH